MFDLPAFGGESGGLKQDISLVDQAHSSNSWMIISFHNVEDNPSVDAPYSISTADFASFLSYVQSSGVTVLTVNQALNMNITPSQPPTPLTFGKTTLGNILDYAGDTNTIRGSRTQLTQSGMVTSISIAGGTIGQGKMIAAIYADNNGTPSTLIAQTPEIQTNDLAWYTFNFTTPGEVYLVTIGFVG